MDAKNKLTTKLSEIVFKNKNSGKSKTGIQKILKQLDCFNVATYTGKKDNQSTRIFLQRESEHLRIESEMQRSNLRLEVTAGSNDKENTRSKASVRRDNAINSISSYCSGRAIEQTINRQSSCCSGITIYSEPSVCYGRTIRSEESHHGGGAVRNPMKKPTIGKRRVPKFVRMS